MSRNCVDAILEIGRARQIPFVIIASRQQIDSREMGGGYANGWDTRSFASYVRERDADGGLLLARDHGGPWQNERESGLDADAAMASALDSYRTDLEAGFDLIHLDPGKNLEGIPDPEERVALFLERTKTLLAALHDHSRSLGIAPGFEVGTDMGPVGEMAPSTWVPWVERLLDFCREEGLPRPDFLVTPVETRVMETRNVGKLEVKCIDQTSVQQHQGLREWVAFCRRHGLFMKVHNADYSAQHVLTGLSAAGVHAVNVAPEFGVVETRAFLGLLHEVNRLDLRDRLVDLALERGQFKKWLLPNSRATDFDRTVISGHYLFATEPFREIRAEALRACAPRGIDMDRMLREAVRQSVLRYVIAFQAAVGRA